MDLDVGPILGFRGVRNGDEWHTCALIVTEGDAAPEKLEWSAGEESGEATRVPLKTFVRKTDEGREVTYEISRFDWHVEQKDKGQEVTYTLDSGAEHKYNVPAKDASLRIAYGSCAGFHDPSDMKGIDNNAMWEVLAEQHQEKAYHLLIMGGDQVYADTIWTKVPPLADFLQRPREEQLNEPFTDEMREKVEDYYFDLYREKWCQKEPKEVMSRIPSLMMWDDHDIFDGWGSYPEDLQNSEVFKGIYEQARQYFLLFQLQAKDDRDLPEKATLREHDERGEQPNFTSAYRIGDVALAVLDLRSERTREQVMHPETWSALRAWIRKNLEGCEHLLMVSSIPVAYVNWNMLESTLGLVPGHQDLEDDLRDQWRSHAHRQERLDLINDLFDYSKKETCRVTIVSGDVHLAALGQIVSEQGGFTSNGANVIEQLVSSPIVNRPLYGTVIYLMEKVLDFMGVMGRKEEEVGTGITARMIQFPGTSRHFIAARNWLSLELDGERRIIAKWYAEDDKELYKKVIDPITNL